jgi:hypothetical protein
VNIGTIQNQLDFFTDLDSDLLVFHRQMASIIADLAPWAKAEASASEPMAKELSERYTMDQERLIHEQILSGLPPTANSPEADRMMEGFEAFETSETDSGIPNETRGDANDMEWFEDFGGDAHAAETAPDAVAEPSFPHPEKGATDSDPENAFGDNIELF